MPADMEVQVDASLPQRGRALDQESTSDPSHVVP